MSPNQKNILRQIGTDLVLRRSTQADAQALADFNSAIHSDDGPEKPDRRVGVWASDLLRGDHPTFGEGDYTIVEEVQTGKIVSSMNLISQTWSFDGIPFKVGRPELVGTLPEYRNRGLVRMQFDTVHQWSAERGEMLQVITGIPYYYRLFGYEMALELEGGRAGYLPQVPKLKEGQPEPFKIRPASEADVPFIGEIYRNACKRYPLACVWDARALEYEVLRKSPENINRYEYRIIESLDGERLGFFCHPGFLWGTLLGAALFEVKPGVSWGEVAPSVVRYLFSTGKAYAAAEKKDDFSSFGFWLGSEHPVYQVLGNRLPRVRTPYAWYVRTPDLVGFLKLVAPALEARLARSLYPGHSDELKITFYRPSPPYPAGVRLLLEKGKLATIEAYRPEPVGHAGNAAFPGLTFLQLLFGYRSLAEIRYAFPDCWTDNDEINGLLNAMFPRQSSDIMPVS